MSWLHAITFSHNTLIPTLDPSAPHVHFRKSFGIYRMIDFITVNKHMQRDSSGEKLHANWVDSQAPHSLAHVDTLAHSSMASAVPFPNSPSLSTLCKTSILSVRHGDRTLSFWPGPISQPVGHWATTFLNPSVHKFCPHTLSAHWGPEKQFRALTASDHFANLFL